MGAEVSFLENIDQTSRYLLICEISTDTNGEKLWLAICLVSILCGYITIQELISMLRSKVLCKQMNEQLGNYLTVEIITQVTKYYSIFFFLFRIISIHQGKWYLIYMYSFNEFNKGSGKEITKEPMIYFNEIRSTIYTGD